MNKYNKANMTLNCNKDDEICSMTKFVCKQLWDGMKWGRNSEETPPDLIGWTKVRISIRHSIYSPKKATFPVSFRYQLRLQAAMQSLHSFHVPSETTQINQLTHLLGIREKCPPPHPTSPSPNFMDTVATLFPPFHHSYGAPPPPIGVLSK